jgi:porphyrinogen peroxidase
MSAPWRERLTETASASKEAGKTLTADVLRWHRIEMDAGRLLISGIALALPVAIGAASGRLDLGLIAVIGALLVSGSGHEGTARQRLADMAATAAVGTAAVAIGASVAPHTAWASAVIIAVAFLAGLAGGIRASITKAASQATVFLILGANMGKGPTPLHEMIGLILLGAVGAALLGLSVYGAGRLIPPEWAGTEGDEETRRWERGLERWFSTSGTEVPPPPRTVRADLRRWSKGLRRLPAWNYPIRLGACMAVAEAFAHLRPGTHSYWTALTVALVVQRDGDAARVRTFQRGLGTVIGVGIGGLLLGGMPTWTLVTLIGVIGAIRPHLKTANYTAYAAVMTPLIVVMNDLGHAMSWAVLRERVVDTLLGCLISLTVGTLLGRALTRGSTAAAPAATPPASTNGGPSKPLVASETSSGEPGQRSTAKEPAPPMTTQATQSSPAKPQAVVSPLTSAAMFLVVTVGENGEKAVRDLLPDLSGLRRSVGFRAPESGLTCVLGIGSDAWDRLFAGPRPAELHPFTALRGAKHVAPSTPGDLLLHIRADRMDLCHELADQILQRLRGAAKVVDEVHGFQYFDERDLLGFVDGTENPEDDKALDAALTDAADPFPGGSYVIVQKYLHDLDAWRALTVEAQEHAVGRTKTDDIELPDDVKPADSHVALTVIEDENGEEQQILRKNMPFANHARGEYGTYFIGYARTPTVTEQMLRNMFLGTDDAPHDRILDFSTAMTGSLYFVPPAGFLDTPPDAP